MSSSNGVNGGMTAAQRLQLQHEHNPIVEDVPDESDLKHPPAPLSDTHVLEDLDEPAPASDWPANMSANAAGKRKAETSAGKQPALDPNSTTSFPGLGGTSKSAAPVLAPIWGGSKSAANGAQNGVSNGTSTPNSGVNTPPTSRGASQPAVQIQAPRLVLQKNEVLPRNQLKKPLPDILKDINKKLRTNLTMRTGENGVLEFRETSNQKENLKQQAVRDLGVQIGAKVRFIRSGENVLY